MTDESNVALTDNVIQSRALALAAAQDSMQFLEVNPDFGTTWDFEANPIFVGLLVSRKTIEQEAIGGGTRDAIAYECIGADQEKYTLWGSWGLDTKLKDIANGSVIRVEYKGKQSFKSDDGEPRQVRRYKVSVAALSND